MNKNERLLLGFTLVSSAVAMILPSLITQYNWLRNEQGLAPLEERRKVLLFSYILSAIVILIGFSIVKKGGD